MPWLSGRALDKRVGGRTSNGWIGVGGGCAMVGFMGGRETGGGVLCLGGLVGV